LENKIKHENALKHRNPKGCEDLAPKESHPKNHKINHIKQPQDIFWKKIKCGKKPKQKNP
jgi:hypothetical protein